MIGAEEMGRLRLTAPPGLDLVGLRVWMADGEPGVVLEPHTSGAWRVWCVAREVSPEPRGYVCSDFGVDLADASTADRVARWVAGRVGLEVGCTAPTWTWHHGFRWCLYGESATPAVFADLNDTGEVVGHHVVGMPRGIFGTARLPDGSRYVDRLALALVAVHVGGQP